MRAVCATGFIWRDDVYAMQEALGGACIFGCAKILFVVACAGVVHAMFAEMLIHFRFGKFLHVYHPYVLLLGEVLPNFSGDHVYAWMCVSLCGCACICCGSN